MPARSDREAGSASAARRRVGIGHAERRAAHILDIVDRAAADEIEADGIDHEAHAIAFGDSIIALHSVGHLELVLETGATAAVDRQAQYRRLALLVRDRRDTRGGRRGEIDFAHDLEDRSVARSKQWKVFRQRRSGAQSLSSFASSGPPSAMPAAVRASIAVT